MGTKPKIFIVDDDVDFATAICTVFEDNGFIADTAHNLNTTLSKVRDNEYDLIFMDMNLSDTNGLEVFKKIKEIRHDVKVIIMTGDPYTVSKLYRESVTEGMIDDDYLRKPFPPDEIIDIAKKYTSNK